MKPEAVAAKIQTNAKEIRKSALVGLKEADRKLIAVNEMENVTEQTAGILMRGHQNCRKELETVSELSQVVLDEVPKYLAASEKGDDEEAEKILQTVEDTDSEIELCLGRVRGFQRRLHTMAEKIERIEKIEKIEKVG